jgi:hypothetical protein
MGNLHHEAETASSEAMQLSLESDVVGAFVLGVLGVNSLHFTLFVSVSRAPVLETVTFTPTLIQLEC